MKRQMFVDFQSGPINVKLHAKAGPDYTGYFHYHRGIELLYIHQGEGSVILNQQVHKIEPGILFLFQPHQLHYVKAITDSGPYIRSIIHFEPHKAMKPLGRLANTVKHIWKNNLTSHVFRDFGMRHPVETICEYYKHKVSNASPEEKNTLCEVLLSQLILFLDQENSLSKAESTFYSRPVSHAEAVMEWIELYYDQPFRLEELACHLHLSKYHISHRFKEETGHSITEYLLVRRTQAACMLLETSDFSIETIGVKVGWPVPSHFAYQFRKKVGCSPTQYRSRQRNLISGS